VGLGEPFGLISYDQITAWIPIFLFAMLFGLSMDYEVFLVSRMREEWDATHDNVQAVTVGLAKTGRLVTAAGLIMVAAFMGFVVGSFVDLQQFGFGLAAAILIDVTVVRALLLPSAMRLFGRWNWWLPAGVARIFRVEPSPLQPATAPAGGGWPEQEGALVRQYGSGPAKLATEDPEQQPVTPRGDS
jgi:RND superfamily putative drug exporter